MQGSCGSRRGSSLIETPGLRHGNAPLMPPWCGLLRGSVGCGGTRSIRRQLAAASFRLFALLQTVAGGCRQAITGRCGSEIDQRSAAPLIASPSDFPLLDDPERFGGHSRGTLGAAS